MKTFFKKLKYHFLIQSTKIESTSFSYKNALSEVDVKATRMGVQYRHITRNGVLSVTTLF